MAGLFSGAAIAAPVEVYIEQELSSNATDESIYTTEAGAVIDTSDKGYVYIGFDDQGWLAAGYGHSFDLSDRWSLDLYGELGKWEDGEEMLLEAIVDYQLVDNINLFAGYGYNRSGQTPELLSDTTINTNQVIAGTSMAFGQFSLDYTYTHEKRDGSNGFIDGSEGKVSFAQDSYRTNEHEVVFSMHIDDWRPYVKYTYFNSNADSADLFKVAPYSNNNQPIYVPVDSDHIWTIGLAYQF
ncbi:hypothetical protein QWJ08_09785 [Vibrio agarivorans]|uniref:Porin n=1 Tax=Vibrio agarivorans TaxID=153622 RepID=A0ABT7Y1P7_9VIBR|nr:hypothetical protein [Vibrio agarivorans]MDN2481684.1 hypothetical protein [Vibrio agarivorans]